MKNEERHYKKNWIAKNCHQLVIQNAEIKKDLSSPKTRNESLTWRKMSFGHNKTHVSFPKYNPNEETFGLNHSKQHSAFKTVSPKMKSKKRGIITSFLLANLKLIIALIV